MRTFSLLILLCLMGPSLNAMNKRTRPPEQSLYKQGKRKRVLRACDNCRKSHLKCDSNRPCHQCRRKGLQDTCGTGERDLNFYRRIEYRNVEIKYDENGNIVNMQELMPEPEWHEVQRRATNYNTQPEFDDDEEVAKIVEILCSLSCRFVSEPSEHSDSRES